MLKATKRTLAAAVVIAAASAPSAAYARFNLAPAPPGTSHPAERTITPSTPKAEVSSPGGFQWGDAGLGAAGTLVLLGTGAGSAAVVSRRRAHHSIS
jgi:hypothetical protein